MATRENPPQAPTGRRVAATIWPRMLLPVALLAIGAAQLRLAVTSAQQLSLAGAETVHFRALHSHEALQLSPPAVDLGSLAAGETVGRTLVARVRNTSPRTLTLQVSLEGIPGMAARLEQAELGPGEASGIEVTGRPWDLGALDGRLVVTSLDGFLRREGQLRLQVLLPAPAPGRLPVGRPNLTINPPRLRPADPALPPQAPPEAPPAPAPASPDQVRPGGYRESGPGLPRSEIHSGRE